jgi:type I restriction enzyme, R subunit
MKGISANLGFLGTYDAQLVRLGGLAERYFKDDPNTCLIKLRQFGEVLAQLTAAKSGLLASPESSKPIFSAA